MRIVRYAVMLLLLFLNGPLFLAAQDSDWNRQITEMSAMNPAQTTGDYRLGPGDLLEITVAGADELGGKVRISSSGTISLPYIGLMQLTNLTAAELEQRLAASLVEKKLIKSPQVSVFISEYQSQPVFVMGAVQRPGQYMMTRQLRVIDALALAGGLVMENAAHYAILQRRVESEQATRSVSTTKNSTSW